MMDKRQGSPPSKRMMCKKDSSSAQSSAAAAIISGNDDLLIEIFLFLPARSLVRFKLVSKHWRSLITTSSFARLHILHHPLRRPELEKSFILSGWFPQFFICDASIRRLVRFHFRLSYVKLLQSCNGLLLLECKRSAFSSTLIYTVFNPTTMKSRILIKRETPLLLALFFDPSNSPYYKVVCFEKSNDSDDYTDHLSIYDSQTNTWKEEDTSEILSSAKCSTGVYWNDGVYFLRGLGTLFCLFSDGSLEYIPPPPIARPPGAKVRRYIMESGGHLHFLVLSLMRDDNFLIVYELNEDASDWLIKYTADFNPISAVRNFQCCLIGLIRGERERDSMVLFHMPGKIMIYKFLCRTFKVLVTFKTEDYYEEGELQFGLKKPTFPFIGTLAHV